MFSTGTWWDSQTLVKTDWLVGHCYILAFSEIQIHLFPRPSNLIYAMSYQDCALSLLTHQPENPIMHQCVQTPISSFFSLNWSLSLCWLHWKFRLPIPPLWRSLPLFIVPMPLEYKGHHWGYGVGVSPDKSLRAMQGCTPREALIPIKLSPEIGLASSSIVFSPSLDIFI